MGISVKVKKSKERGYRLSPEGAWVSGGDEAWFYEEPKGISIYIELEDKKIVSAVLSWKQVAAAMRSHRRVCDQKKRNHAV